MTNINNNTKNFLEQMCELFEECEEKSLTEEYWNKSLIELLILKYGKFELKYSIQESLIMAALIIRRGFSRKVAGKIVWFTADEYIDLFSFLFRKKENRSLKQKTEYLPRIEIFLKEIRKC